MHWFITGYTRDHRFDATAAPAPADDAERGTQLDQLHYSHQAQNNGMLAFTVQADDEREALRHGQHAYTAWKNNPSPQ